MVSGLIQSELFSFYPGNLLPKTNNLIKMIPVQIMMDTSHSFSKLQSCTGLHHSYNKKTIQSKKCKNLFCSSLSFDRKKTFSDENWEMICLGPSWRYSNLNNNQPPASLSARSSCNSSAQRQIDLKLGLMFTTQI